VRGGDEQQGFGVGREQLAAPRRPLQRRQQRRNPIEVLVGVAIVPHPDREQREDVGEVVVEQDRERDGIGRLVTALVDQVVKDVDRNGVVVDPIGDAVPVVEHVKSERARLAVVALHEALEVERHATRGPHVGAHPVAQPAQRLSEVAGGRRLGHHVAAQRSVERVVDESENVLET
jgi:hypothetical protein